MNSDKQLFYTDNFFGLAWIWEEKLSLQLIIITLKENQGPDYATKEAAIEKFHAAYLRCLCVEKQSSISNKMSIDIFQLK